MIEYPSHRNLHPPKQEQLVGTLSRGYSSLLFDCTWYTVNLDHNHRLKKTIRKLPIPKNDLSLTPLPEATTLGVVVTDPATVIDSGNSQPSHEPTSRNISRNTFVRVRTQSGRLWLWCCL